MSHRTLNSSALLLTFFSLNLFADSARVTGGGAEGGPVLCVAAVDGGVAYAGVWGGLYRMTDTESGWSLLDLPFADPVSSLSWDAQYSRLFAGASGRIFVSDASGAVWSTLQLRRRPSCHGDSL